MLEPIETPVLGACCVCGKHGLDVVNILMLHFRAPEAGKGWGCVVCGLPLDGAIAVLCDSCLWDVQTKKKRITYVCAGYPYEDRRVAIDSFDQQPFEHHMEFHCHERRDTFN
jgi:hypothetical protein